MSAQSEKVLRRQKFESVFAVIRDELIEHIKRQGMPNEAVEWYRRNLNYNVPGGKLNRGMSVVDSVEILKGRKLGDDEYLKAAILGWCIELLQAFFLVSDDIMDQSITRRSQPCWYRIEHIGNIAINDAFMLEAAIYHLLKSHFRGEPYYVNLLELFHETAYQTEMGQLLDLITAPEDEVDLDKFTLDKHHLIVIYKTAFYSFYLPVALAMRMCNIPESYPGSSPGAPDQRPYDIAVSILLPLGKYFQVQDDFLDYYADPEALGKIGTDIIDNKCSWCINTALKIATPEQRRVLYENYGRKDSAKEAKVKEVYKEMGIEKIYKEYEDGVVTEIMTMIEKIPDGEPGAPVLQRQVFKSFLDKIYKRSK